MTEAEEEAVQELMAATEPFAAAMNNLRPSDHDDWIVDDEIFSVGSVRRLSRARDALARLLDGGE
jgi:hypothetical protein